MSVALKSLFGPGFAFSLRIGVAALALLVFSGIIGSSDAEAQDDTDPKLEVEVEEGDPPTLVSLDRPVRYGESVTLTGPEGFTIYTWTQTSGTDVPLDGEDTDTATFDAPSIDGDLVFQLTITSESDSNPAPDLDSVTIKVDGTPPRALAGVDKTVAERGTVTLSGSGFDPGGGAFTVAWTPSEMFTSATSALATFNAPPVTADTTFTVTLTVTDAAGNTAEDMVDIEVTNRPLRGAVSANVMEVESGGDVRLTGSVSNNDGTVTYSWSAASATDPAEGSFSSSTAPAVTWTAPTVTADTSFTLTLTISDGARNVSPTATVLVTAPAPAPTPTPVDSTAPVANAGSPRTVGIGAMVTLDGSGSTDNIGVTSYEWSGPSGVELTDAGTASPTFTAPDTVGDLEFSLLVTDAAGNTDIDSVTVAVVDSGPGINRLKEIMMLFVSEINTGTATALDARMDRFRSGMAASAALSIAGQQINPAATSLTGDAEQMDSRILSHDRASSGMAANPYHTYSATGFGRDDAGGSGLLATRGISSDDLRRDTSFNFTAGSTGGASAAGSGSGDSAVSIWGQLSTGGFEREPRENDLVEGDVAAIHVGADYARDDWMVGLGVLHATTEGEYTERPEGGQSSVIDLDLDLTAIFPYAAFNVSEKTAFWLSGIYGRGTIEVEEKGSAPPETGEVDSEIYGIAAGMTRRLWQDGSQSLSMKGDIESTEIKTGSQEGEAGVKYEIVEDSAYIAQGRIGIEGQGTRKMEGGTHLTGAFEGMAIFDAGDGREGVGVEFGGEVRAVFPVGLTLSGSGRYLVAHTEEGAQDWSLSLAARYDPGIVGQGGYFNLAPRYGQANSTQDMWSRDLVALAEDGADDDDALQFSFETGYRFPQVGLLGRVEPYFGYDGKGGLSDGDLRFGSHVHPNPNIDLSLEAKRKFSDTGTDSSDLWLRGRVRF